MYFLNVLIFIYHRACKSFLSFQLLGGGVFNSSSVTVVLLFSGLTSLYLFKFILQFDAATVVVSTFQMR